MKTLARVGDKEELLRRLLVLRPESARRWGRMTAPQMVCHLADGFRMALGDRPVAHVSTRLSRTVVKWIALYAPMPWPHGVRTRPEIDPTARGTQPAVFAADVAEVAALVDVIVQTKSLEGYEHPYFGRLSDAEWRRWSYLHVDHHLRQFGA
jgi:hypothetical protein